MFRSFEPDDGLNRFAPGQAGGRTYDGAGRRTRLTHPDSQAFTYAYDNLSRLSGVYQGTGTGTPLATFDYASNGLVSSRSEGTGASSATYGWDDIGRLTSQADAFSGGTNNVSWTFAYNPASQIVTETRSNDSYGLAKTNVNLSYAVNGLNQYTSAGGASLSYDANGNLTDDGPATYTYDIENRLVKAVAGATTTNLVYDPLGRLFEVNQGTSGTTKRFLNDGDAMVLELGSVNQVTDRYVHGSNAAADDPLVWYPGSGLLIKRWLHADHLGSIVAVTNSSGGSPSINRYDEYGVPAATNIGRFQYTGQAWIPELGLYYYKARFYSPGLGRFMQTDPIGYEGGFNLYNYVGNDPLNSLDSSGLICTGSRIEESCGGGGLSMGASGFSTADPTGRTESLVQLTFLGVAQGSGLKRNLTPGERLMRQLLKDPDVRESMEDAWDRSRGFGPTREKNEHGFWIASRGNDFIAGRIIEGQDTGIRRDHITNARTEMPDAWIFFHTHPFRVGERGVTSLYLSELDRGVASHFRSVIISVACPTVHCTRGRGWVFDVDESFHVP